MITVPPDRELAEVLHVGRAGARAGRRRRRSRGCGRRPRRSTRLASRRRATQRRRRPGSARDRRDAGGSRVSAKCSARKSWMSVTCRPASVSVERRQRRGSRASISSTCVDLVGVDVRVLDPVHVLDELVAGELLDHQARAPCTGPCSTARRPACRRTAGCGRGAACRRAPARGSSRGTARSCCATSRPAARWLALGIHGRHHSRAVQSGRSLSFWIRCGSWSKPASPRRRGWSVKLPERVAVGARARDRRAPARATRSSPAVAHGVPPVAAERGQLVQRAGAVDERAQLADRLVGRSRRSTAR